MSNYLKTLSEIPEPIDLRAKETASLTDELLELRRTHRADLDRMHLEIETLKLFLAQRHPDFEKAFPELRKMADREISPE